MTQDDYEGQGQLPGVRKRVKKEAPNGGVLETTEVEVWAETIENAVTVLEKVFDDDE